MRALKTSRLRNIYISLKLGERLYLLGSLVGYFLFLPYLNSQNELVHDWVYRNALIQTLIFVPIAFIPSWFTKHMFYVDIAWPTGVMAIGMQTIYLAFALKNFESDAVDIRSLLVGTALTLHGGRMALGAIIVFFPYVRSTDLPRYEYARIRFIHETGGAPYRAWLMKRNHDIFQQYLANVFHLGAIGVLVLSNPHDHWIQTSIISWIGLVIWLFAWVFESIADGQKIIFTALVKKMKDSQNSFVLGQPPFDGSKFFLWTYCRHPNYFFEWLAWCGLVITVLPCVYESYSMQRESLMEVLSWTLLITFIPRFLYDCLMYWTGAAPSEHFSHLKRGQRYLDYQKSTRVFFPFPLPFVNHAQEPGWSTISSKRT